MAIYKSDIVDINLESGSIHRSYLNHTIGSGDNSANRFGVRTFRNGLSEDLSGASCQAIFMNAAGTNIALTSYGTVSGNEAYVTLPQACYNVEGQFTLAIKLVKSGETVTTRIVDGVVCNTGTTGAVAPTASVPTYQEILAVYADMQEDIADYESVVANQNDQINSLKSALGTITGNVEIQFSDPSLKQYIVTNGTTVSWDNPSVHGSDPYKWAVISCSEGDMFTISGRAGNAPRLWAFADSSKNLLDPRAGNGATASDLLLVAPTNAAYLIINDVSDSVSYIGMLEKEQIKETNTRIDKIDNGIKKITGSFIDIPQININPGILVSGIKSLSAGNTIYIVSGNSNIGFIIKNGNTTIREWSKAPFTLISDYSNLYFYARRADSTALSNDDIKSTFFVIRNNDGFVQEDIDLATFYDSDKEYRSFNDYKLIPNSFRPYYSGEVTEDFSTANTTGLIPVSQGDKFEITGRYGSALALVAAFNSGTFVQSASVYNSSSTVDADDYQYIVPTGVTHIAFSWYKSGAEFVAKKYSYRTVKTEIATLFNNENDANSNIEHLLTISGGEAAKVIESNFPTESDALNGSNVQNKTIVYGASDYLRKIGRTSSHGTITNAIVPASCKRADDSYGGMAQVEFGYDGTEFDVIMYGNNTRYQIYEQMNGEWVGLEKDFVVISGDVFRRISISFDEPTIRQFRVVFSGAFYGVVFDITKSVFEKGKYRPTCVIEGSSITQATNIIGFYGASWGMKLCNDMGFDFINCGVGGTGYISDNLGSNTTIPERIDYDAVQIEPEYLIIEGGINDTIRADSTQEKIDELFAAVRQCIHDVQEGSPNTFIVLVGRVQPRQITGTTEPSSAIYSENTYTTANELFMSNDIIRAVALEKEVPFIDLMRGQAVDKDGNVIMQTRKMLTGTGWVASPELDGNADTYIGSTSEPTDNIHLNVKGQNYMGEYIYALYSAILDKR